MFALLVSAVLTAPFSIAVAPVEGGSKDLPTAELDTLISAALNAARTADRVALAPKPEEAEILVQPSIERLSNGKVRVTWALAQRGSAKRDRVAFDFSKPTFGPSGTQAMVDGVITRALKLKNTAEVAEVPRASFNLNDTAGSSSASSGIEESNRPQSKGFRLGVGAGVSMFVPGPLFGPSIELRPGYQINDMFAVYGDIGAVGTFGFGGMIGASARNVTINVGAAAFWYIGAAFEVLLEKMFFFSLGFQGLSLGWAQTAQSADANGNVVQEATAAAGFAPAISAKVGLGLGDANPATGRRHQFSLSLDLITVFAPNTVTVRQAVRGTSVDQNVNQMGLRVGLAPGISLGWDWR